jgi:hypothetical protein
MSKQRSERRVLARGSVAYTSNPDDSGKMQTGLISNLSNNGACIFTQEPITSVNMSVYINGADDPMKAEVLWCREADKNLYKVGLRFP